MPNPKKKPCSSCSDYPSVLTRFAKKYRPKITRSVAAKFTKRPKKSPQKKREEAELSKVVDECVYFILIADQQKYPIERVDIVKKVLPHSPRLFRSIFDRIQERLFKVFGFKLREVENKKGQYIVLNALDTELDLSDLSEDELYQRGFLYYILSLIFMSGGTITEDLLWDALKQLDVDVDSRTPHPVLVDIRKFVMDELTKQLYLKTEPIPDSDPLKHYLSWGFRAECEASKKEVLNLIAESKNTSVQRKRYSSRRTRTGNSQATSRVSHLPLDRDVTRFLPFSD